MNQEFTEEKAKQMALVIDIMKLAYLIHEFTEYCVFIQFSGHVNILRIDIRESKKNWQTEMLESEFRTPSSELKNAKDQTEYLNAKKDVLKRILDEREIPYELVKTEIIETEYYTF